MSPNLPHPILKRLQIVPAVIPAFTIIYEIAHLISVSSGSRTNNVFATSTYTIYWYFSHEYFGVPRLQIEEFLRKSSCVLNKYNGLLSLHKHTCIMETEFNIWVKDDTFNKKKISTLLKAKIETSSFRVYKKAPQCLIKHLILSGGFHGSDEKKKGSFTLIR